MKHFLTAILLFATLQAPAGNSVRNGGDFVASDFIQTGRLALHELANLDLTAPELEAVTAIVEVIDKVQVNSGPQQYINTIPVDAINISAENRIMISRNRWIETSKLGPEYHMGLVLHEYLGIVHVVDTEYKMSQALVGKLTPVFLTQAAAKEIFLDVLHNLHTDFWVYENFGRDSSIGQFCFGAGQTQSDVSRLTQIAQQQAAWFTSEKRLNELLASMTNLSDLVEQSCKAEKIDYDAINKAAYEATAATDELKQMLID